MPAHHKINPGVLLVPGATKGSMHEDSSRAVLTMLAGSGEARKWPQFLAALTATLGALCTGTNFAWTASAKPLLTNHTTGSKLYLTEAEFSWVSALFTLGAFVGCLPASIAAERLGRQRSLLYLSLPLLLSWLCMALGDNAWWLYVGRFEAGVAVGALSVITGMYVTEIGEPSVRGTLGSFFQLQITIGILFGYIAGKVHDTQTLAFVDMALPAVFAGAIFFMPESPVYLLSKGRSEDARDALQWLRGPDYDISEEIARIRHANLEAQQSKASVKDLFASRAARRGMLVALGLMAFQQLSGINAVIFYTTEIFKRAGTSFSEETCTIIVGVVQVLATYLSTVLVDRAGRRVLLLLSCGVMGICLAVLGTYFILNDAKHDLSHITWLPLVVLALFIVMFSLGMGPLPWLVVGEIFSPSIKGLASSIACATNWMLATVVTKEFSDMKNELGIGGAFWVFAAVCVVGTIYIAILVPETKGKTLDEVQAELAGVKGYPKPMPEARDGRGSENGDEADIATRFTL